MDVVIDEWSIVVAGRWNKWTFTPPWLAEHGVWSPSFQCETVIEHGHAANHFHMDDIVLVPHHDRLVVVLRGATDSALLHGETLIRELLRLLPNTPVTAVGVNFGFGGPSPMPEPLAELMALDDVLRLEDLGLVSSRTEISRALAYREGVLNMLVGAAPDGWGIRLNFHNPVPNAAHALEFVEGHPLRCRDDGLSMLKSLYGLSCSLGDPEAN